MGSSCAWKKTCDNGWNRQWLCIHLEEVWGVFHAPDTNQLGGCRDCWGHTCSANKLVSQQKSLGTPRGSGIEAHTLTRRVKWSKTLTAGEAEIFSAFPFLDSWNKTSLKNPLFSWVNLLFWIAFNCIPSPGSLYKGHVSSLYPSTVYAAHNITFSSCDDKSCWNAAKSPASQILNVALWWVSWGRR